MKNLRIQVPASLLIAGEYAILEPQGKGFIMSIEPYLECSIQIANNWKIQGIYHQQVIDVSSKDQTTDLGFLWNQGLNQIQQRGLTPKKAHVFFDSRAFYHSNGLKKGYGSSASLAVAVAYTLLYLSGIPEKERVHQTHALALNIHRQLQNGKGSGYDITAAVYGEMGFFHAGEMPRYEKCQLSYLPYMYIFSGAKPLTTKTAIHIFYQWKKQQMLLWKSIYQKSNTIIDHFKKVENWQQWLWQIKQARQVGLQIGDCLDCSAQMQAPSLKMDSETCFKASGAGNEIGILFSQQPIQAPDLTPIHTSTGIKAW